MPFLFSNCNTAGSFQSARGQRRETSACFKLVLQPVFSKPKKDFFFSLVTAYFWKIFSFSRGLKKIDSTYTPLLSNKRYTKSTVLIYLPLQIIGEIVKYWVLLLWTRFGRYWTPKVSLPWVKLGTFWRLVSSDFEKL